VRALSSRNALFVGGDAFFVTLAARDRIPAVFPGGRDYPAAGGLMGGPTRSGLPG
jgi:hypothetical protein